MTNQKQWLDWIDGKNPKQCQWAIEYVAKHGFTLIENDYLPVIRFERINEYLNKECSVEASTLLIQKMRAAWNQKKNRDKGSGRKAYSFVMSISVEQKLKKLAGDNTINRTLEELIDLGHEYEQKKKGLLAEAIEKKEKELEKKYSIDGKINKSEQRRQNLKIRRLEATEKLQKVLIDGLVFKTCKQEILLRESKLENQDLSTEQKNLALQNQESQIRFYEKDLKSELALLSTTD